MSLTSIYGNYLQIDNCFYFWKFLTRDIVREHLQFVFCCGWFAIMYLLGYISPMAYVIGSIMFAFRLSGSYVLFVVANKRSKTMLSSRFSSMYTGPDWNVIVWVVLFTVAPFVADGFVFDPSRANINVVTLTTSTYQEVMVFFCAMHLLAVMVLDVITCLPYLVPQHHHKGLARLLF